MSNPLADRIIEHLGTVAHLRALREADPLQSQRVLALKAYQAARFERSYADLLAHARYGAAARFFLDELYGPQEFSRRDAQFERVVPALVRLFPGELVATVEQLGQLHALTEALDDSAARHLPDPPGQPCSAAGYTQAWQAAGRAPAREQQITLTLAIGSALDRYTRSRLMRSTLRLMRGPAQAAGLDELQRFLESGFEAFGAMRGADEFLGTVARRERALAAALFAPGAVQQAALPPADRPAALAVLP
ncbi:MAG: hypothetical protein V4795_15040 [Pseudomonadota bacterium]